MTTKSLDTGLTGCPCCAGRHLSVTNSTFGASKRSFARKTSATVSPFTKGDDMGLADDLENLERLQREGALSEDEYRRAKAALLTPVAEAAGSAQVSSPNRKRNRVVVIGAALLVLAAVGIGGAVLALTGDDKETIDQRSDTDCDRLSQELVAQNEPMAEVYPTLRGMGCGNWLEERFEEAGSN